VQEGRSGEEYTSKGIDLSIAGVQSKGKKRRHKKSVKKRLMKRLQGQENSLVLLEPKRGYWHD